MIMERLPFLTCHDVLLGMVCPSFLMVQSHFDATTIVTNVYADPPGCLWVQRLLV